MSTLRADAAAELRGSSAAAWTLLLLVRTYITFLSPFFGGACRFHPSCSNYAVEAIQRHGARRGLGLAVWRLLRCNPFNKPGFDPVPDETPSARASGSARSTGGLP
jgi:putative membrane protein insertion efficiency factor